MCSVPTASNAAAPLASPKHLARIQAICVQCGITVTLNHFGGLKLTLFAMSLRSVLLLTAIAVHFTDEPGMSLKAKL